MSNWTQLQRLHLAQNHLTGTLPAGITASPRLRHLLLGMNQFTGYVPQGWGLLPQLRVLSVVRVRWCGGWLLATGAEPFVGPPSCEQIGNDLSGPMPNVMNNSELEFLDVSFNRFDGNLVPLFALNQLRLLRVNSNHLTGPFPSEVLHFPKLHSLYMSRNLLSCKLPAFPAPFLKQVGMVWLCTVRRGRLTLVALCPQFGGENFDILIGNHWECPIPPILASIDTHYDECVPPSRCCSVLAITLYRSQVLLWHGVEAVLHCRRLLRALRDCWPCPHLPMARTQQASAGEAPQFHG